MIEVTDLVKQYGQKTAVDHISFQIQPGEIVGFLGPNGAGKSTTMNILTGYISATEGSVKIDGISVLEDPIHAKRKIGYLPELPPLYLDMTVQEQLNFAYDLKGIKSTPEAKQEHIDKVCQLVKISDVQGRMIKNLSKGYKQRVGLAQALMGSPEVLILDEPTVGLDPKQIIEIRNLIAELGKTHTIILSSHILPEISAVCERVLVINKGKIVADGRPEDLSRALSGDNRLLARIEGPAEEIVTLIQQIPGVDKCILGESREEGTCDFYIETEMDVDIRRTLFHMMADRNYAVLMLKPLELTLEDIFLQLTQEQENASAQAASKAEMPAQVLPQEQQQETPGEAHEEPQAEEDLSARVDAHVEDILGNRMDAQPEEDTPEGIRMRLQQQEQQEQALREEEAEQQAAQYAPPILDEEEEEKKEGGDEA